MTAENLNLIGRVFVAAYFIWATWFNYKAWNHHVAEFKRIGISQGSAALTVGLVAQLAGSVLLLWPGHIVLGGVLLIGFTAGADLLFHRFWTYSDPHEQVIHKFFLFEHVALMGGILGLIAPHL